MANENLAFEQSYVEPGFNLVRYLSEPSTHTKRKPRTVLFVRCHGSNASVKEIALAFNSECAAFSLQDGSASIILPSIYQAIYGGDSVLIELQTTPSQSLKRLFLSASRGGVLAFPLGLILDCDALTTPLLLPDESTLGLVVDQELFESGMLETSFVSAFCLIVLVKGGQ